MRPLSVVLALLLSTIATRASSLVLQPEQPVSSLAVGPAAGNQQTLAVASNGQIGFAVWLDQRRGTTDLFGSRLDPSGSALDGPGILLATLVTGGSVVWNGSEFVALAERGGEKQFVFVTAEGTVSDRRSIVLLNYQWVAALGSGSDARFLFIGPGAAAIVDGAGNVVASNVPTGMPAYDWLRVAGAGGSEFLVLHSTYTPASHLFAERIGSDGRVLSSAVDTGVDLSTFGTTLALAGGSDGDYLLVGRGATDREVIAVHLDRNGVQKGPLKHFEPFDATCRVSYPVARPAVRRDADVYEVAWTTSAADGSVHTSLVREPASDTPPLPQVFPHPLESMGMGYGTTLGRIGANLVVVTDAFRTPDSTTIDPVATILDESLEHGPEPFVLAVTATHQSSPQIAATATEHAVLWMEERAGGTDLRLRRYPSSGSPLIVPVASNPLIQAGQPVQASIAASGNVYVIAWATSTTASGDNTYVVRRLRTTGDWIDPEPLPLATAKELVLAGGTDGALALYTVACSFTRCLRARAIGAGAGSPAVSAETVPAAGPAYQLALTSNGHDYLAAWNDNVCVFPCDVPFPSRIVAVSLGADGGALQSGTTVLDDTPGSFPANPSITWDGGRYAVSWTRDSSIVGAHVSALGVPDGQREVLHRPPQLLSQKLVANAGSSVLFMTYQAGSTSATWSVSVNPETLVAIGEPESVVSGQPAYSTSIAAVAVSPGNLAMAYERLDEGEGFVGRVFHRLLGGTVRRRAVR